MAGKTGKTGRGGRRRKPANEDETIEDEVPMTDSNDDNKVRSRDPTPASQMQTRSSLHQRRHSSATRTHQHVVHDHLASATGEPAASQQLRDELQNAALDSVVPGADDHPHSQAPKPRLCTVVTLIWAAVFVAILSVVIYLMGCRDGYNNAWTRFLKVEGEFEGDF